MKQHLQGRYRLGDFMRLIRVEDYGTFIQLVIGYILANGNEWLYLAGALAILAPCIYGGLYSINDAHDATADRSHPVKRTRPVAAERITPQSAYGLGVSLICLGLSIACMFDLKVLVLALLFVSINLGYTFRFKSIPYLEIVANTITHPLRFAAGVWLAGGQIDWLLVAAWTLAVFAITTLKRVKEMREASSTVRPVLRFYNEPKLKGLIIVSLGILLGMLPFMCGNRFVLTGAWIALTLTAVIGYFRIPTLTRLMEYLWR